MSFDATCTHSNSSHAIGFPINNVCARLGGAGVAVTDLRYTMTHTIATPDVRARMDTDIAAAVRSVLHHTTAPA